MPIETGFFAHRYDMCADCNAFRDLPSVYNTAAVRSTDTDCVPVYPCLCIIRTVFCLFQVERPHTLRLFSSDRIQTASFPAQGTCMTALFNCRK